MGMSLVLSLRSGLTARKEDAGQAARRLGGQEVRQQRAVEEIDRDFAVLATLCEASEPANEEQLDRALQEAHRQAKEQARRNPEQPSNHLPTKRHNVSLWNGTSCPRAPDVQV